MLYNPLQWLTSLALLCILVLLFKGLLELDAAEPENSAANLTGFVIALLVMVLCFFFIWN